MENSPSSTTPSKATPTSAGFDLYCCEEIKIPSYDQALVKLGIGIIVPKGIYERIALRSRLALYYFLNIGAEVIN